MSAKSDYDTRWENTETGEFVEINPAGRIRRGKLEDCQPYPSSGNIKIDQIPQIIKKLESDGFKGNGIAGSVWHFTPNENIESKIRNDPENEANYLEYATWLESHGQTYLAGLIRKGGIEDNNDASWELLGNYYDYATNLSNWRYGFPRLLEFVNDKDWDEVAVILNLPICRFLEDININGEEGLEPVIDMLDGWDGLDNLNKLSLWNESYTDFGDIKILWPRLKNLEILYLIGPTYGVDDELFDHGILDFPNLKHFTRQTTEMDESDLEKIFNSSLPQLEALSLTTGFESDLEPDSFKPLFSGKLFPELRSLAIRRCTIADKLIEPLAHSDLLPRLKNLSFYQSNLSCEGAELLLKYKEKFKSLESIIISETVLNVEMEENLTSVFSSIDKHNPFREDPDEVPYIDANYQENFWEKSDDDDW